MSGKFTKIPAVKAAPLESQKTIFANQNRYLRSSTLLLIAFLAVSCFEQGDCLVTNENLLKVNFRLYSDKKTLAPTSIESLTIPGIAILYGDTLFNTFPIPVVPGQPQTEYVFDFGDRTDTLVLEYKNEIRVLNPSCGAFEYQVDLSLGKNTFGEDRVKLTGTQLLKNASVSIDIYF